MSISRQLYQLQELDVELASDEKAAGQISAQLADNRAILAARSRLENERTQLEELGKQQRSIEHDIEDLNSKLSKVENDLYSGRIRNPKELTDLQHEADLLKGQRSQFEDSTFQVMEQADAAAARVSAADAELNRLETDWQSRHQSLSADLEKLHSAIAALREKRQQMVSGIEPEAVEMYQHLKQQKGTGVSRVEGGLCTGCRLTIPVGELQQVRSGNLVRCGSCGRILYLS